MAGLASRVGRSIGGALTTGPGSRGILAPLIAGGAVAGVASGLFGKDSPWRTGVSPQAQEMAFGNPRAIQESMRAGLTAVIAEGANSDIYRPSNYYYGRPVDLKGNSTLGIPVSGEMVFGMYNLRR